MDDGNLKRSGGTSSEYYVFVHSWLVDFCYVSGIHRVFRRDGQAAGVNVCCLLDDVSGGDQGVL